MSKLRVDTHVMFEGLESPRSTHGLAPMSPRPSAFSAGPRPSSVEDGLLAMSAQTEDRQEARRRMAPGGKLLQDNGASSDDGRQEQGYQQQRERLLSLFSPSSSVSGGISLSGAPDDDPNLPPSERYWRERASLMGGRCSVMDHVARVRERRQVQADLRAWVEDVLDGRQMQQEQKQQVENAEQQEQQQRPLSARADTRWGDLPPDLYYKLTGQRPPATAQSPADAQRGAKQHHQRHSVRPRQSVRHSMRNAQQLIQQLAQQQHQPQQQPQHQIDFVPHMQQQQAQQQGLLDANGDTTSSVAENGGGLYLTPRTVQEFGDEVRQQVQQKVDAEVQQQLQQVTQQWQQASLADQQLVQQLQREHQNMQQQLEAAHQQIAALKSGSSIYTAVVAPGRRVTGLAPGSSGELQQHELLTTPAPDVQVLTFLETEEQQDGVSESEEPGAALETLSFKQLVQPDNQVLPAGASRRSKTQGLAAASAEQRSKATPRRAAAAVANNAAKTATPRSVNRSTPSKADGNNNKQPSTPAAAAGVKTPRRPGTGSADTPDSSKNLEHEQQQALLLRLQHAEKVMELLQQDLQASLASKQQLTEQLQAAQAQLKQQQQLQPQKHEGQQPAGQQQQGEQQQQSGGEFGHGSSDPLLVNQLQQEVSELQKQLATTQQGLTDAQQRAREAVNQLQQQQELQEEWQQKCQQQEAVMQQLKGQLLVAQQLQHAAATAGAGDHSGDRSVEQTAAEEVKADSPRVNHEQLHHCEQCQRFEAEVEQLQAQVQQLAGIAEHRTLADQAVVAEVISSLQHGSPDSSRQCYDPAAPAAVSPRAQMKSRGQPLAMKTILCPPPPPGVAAMHPAMYVAGSNGVDPQPDVQSVAKAISTGLMSLRANLDTSTNSDTGKTSEGVLLAGRHRMRPASSRPDSNSSASSMGPAVWPAVGLQARPAANGDRGTAFLQLVGECLTDRPGMLTSRQGGGNAGAVTDNHVSAYNSLQLKGRSRSPKYRETSPRPATADRYFTESTAADKGDVSAILNAVLSPRRPRTAAGASKHTLHSQHLQSGGDGRWLTAVVGEHKNETPNAGGFAAPAHFVGAERHLTGALTSRSLDSAGLRLNPKQVPRLDLARVGTPA